jgi:hypothetical protein
MAHKLSIESDQIRSTVVEASEFPHLAQRYRVMAVPKTVVNDKIEFTGALPEDRFVAEVMKALADVDSATKEQT